MMNKPRLDQGPDYERGFVDGMQHQMQSSVDKAVNRMAQPEPVGRFAKFTDGIWREVTDGSAGQPLYTSPPAQHEPVAKHYVDGGHLVYPTAQRTWVGLTDEDIFSVLGKLQAMYNRPPTEDSRIVFARAIEAALRSKNT